MKDLEQLARCLDAMRALQDGAGAGLFAPPAKGWSAAQHLYHAALATDLALRNVRSLLEDRGPLIRHDAEPSVLLPELLARGSFPPGTVSPRAVTPPATVKEEFLRRELLAASEMAASLFTLLPPLPEARGRIQHQILGFLDASQWMGFARLHAAHHLALAEKALAASA